MPVLRMITQMMLCSLAVTFAGSCRSWQTGRIDLQFVSAPPVYADPARTAITSTMTDAQKIAVREILTTLSSQFDITFARNNRFYAILWPTPVWQ
ncbi:MAG: hypothetical protein IPH22_10765 [Nitrosomonas sp.]|nr:hypothetical protein [Nitrosomonas sp.]